jgi:hypothetical protein
LTHRDNVDSIINLKRIESAELLSLRVRMQNIETFLTTKRTVNIRIYNESQTFILRDQAQIKENALKRSLVNCTYEQFINLVNTKVFFWPTPKDVTSHFGTYLAEGPRILRFSTSDVFAINEPPMFCKLNSGATRPHPYYGGNPAPRGLNTFVSVDNLECNLSKIREVTFSNFCLLPNTYAIAESPEQEFVQYNIGQLLLIFLYKSLKIRQHI